jgi:hypothetical protein
MEMINLIINSDQVIEEWYIEKSNEKNKFIVLLEFLSFCGSLILFIKSMIKIDLENFTQ